MVCPFWQMVPSRCWWLWSPRHVLPWRCLNSSSCVVRISIPFFMNSPLLGSLRCPASHMSNMQERVCSWISLRPGWTNIKDRWGCSQWKCRPCSIWYRYNATARANWYRISWYFCWYSSIWPVERLAFSELQDDHGPHVGLNQRCLGWWMQIWKSFCLVAHPT